jgi:hypothetical protein
VEQAYGESFTYGVTIEGSVAAIVVLAVAVVGGALLGRLFLRGDGS